MKSAMKYVFFPTLALGLLLAVTAYAQDKSKKTEDKKTEDKKTDAKKTDDKKDPAKEATTDYYPLKEGMTWTYKADGKTITVTVAGSEKKGKQPVSCYRLETREKKGDKSELIATEYVAVKEDGVYRYAFEGTDADPPLRFLKLPVDSANKKWTFESKVGGSDVKGSFTQAKETKPVNVPANKKPYEDVYSVTSEGLSIDNQKVSIIYYFAAKVGMIKQEVEVGGTKVTIELEKVEESTKK
jgi:hypothetical protein